MGGAFCFFAGFFETRLGRFHPSERFFSNLFGRFCHLRGGGFFRTMKPQLHRRWYIESNMGFPSLRDRRKWTRYRPNAKPLGFCFGVWSGRRSVLPPYSIVFPASFPQRGEHSLRTKNRNVFLPGDMPRFGAPLQLCRPGFGGGQGAGFGKGQGIGALPGGKEKSNRKGDCVRKTKRIEQAALQPRCGLLFSCHFK